MASSLSKFHLPLAFVVLILFQLSFYAAADPPESDLCNFDDETDLDYSLAPKHVNARGSCLYIGDCNRSKDCKPLCAAKGISAMKCVTNPAGGKHCCCALPKPK
ncbi:uncharacterized protein LOC121050499 [Rosa chinensis]|uniref:uncharacterized protein LOC121050499 n=1 Tax=Rosa chinensis TaxID=74649 RepID=UPI001AD8FFAB|nr:uncharacterized protein LOC121050499 [Rosa chinensis]